MNDLLEILSTPLLLLGYLAYLVMVVASLIHDATTKRWGLFVAMVVFSPIALVYMVVAYETPKTVRERELRRKRVAKRRTNMQERRIRELKAEVARLQSGTGHGLGESPA